MRYHDFHLSGYSVSAFGNRIVLYLIFDYPGRAKEESHIEFSDVACYHFSHTTAAIITDIREDSLAAVIQEQQSFLTQAATQDGLQFWNGPKDTIDTYRERLKAEGYKAYRIESAIGFSGFVIAKSVVGKTPNQTE
jgi:hypothetical protein